MEPVGCFRLRAGFTLVEMLVTMAVLALLMTLIAGLFLNATDMTTMQGKRMDADAQARAVFDRMAIDFAQWVRRSDLDVYLKEPGTAQIGNDQIAFFSEVSGYPPPGFSGITETSPVSLVGYRVNGNDAYLERLGKGLVWNGVAPSVTPMLFLPQKIATFWPAATNGDAEEDYEMIGPQVFRFEYGYILKGQTASSGAGLPSIQSDVPWDTRSGVGHTDVDGLQDVAAITAWIAVVDPRSRLLLSEGEIQSLAAEMRDFTPALQPGELEKQWQSVLDSSSFPSAATSSIRIYSRRFPFIF